MTDDRKRNTGGEVELPALSFAKDAPLRHGSTTILAGDYYTASQYADQSRALAESRAEVERLDRSRSHEHIVAEDALRRAERLAEALRNVLDSGSAIHTPAYEAARAALSLEPNP